MKKMSIDKKILAALSVVTVAATIGAVTVSAVGLGNSTSTAEKEFAVKESEAVTVQLPVDATGTEGKADDLVVVEFPEGALSAGDYKLEVKAVEDIALMQEFDYFANMDGGTVWRSVVIEINLYDADGNAVHDVTPTITLKMAKENYYNAVAVYENGTFSWLTFNGDYVDGRHESTTPDPYTVSGEAPHLSRFVFASIVRETSGSDDEPIAPPQDSSEPEVVESSDEKSYEFISESKSSQSSKGSKPNADKEGYTTGDNGNATAIVFAVMSVAALGTALVATKAKKSEK